MADINILDKLIGRIDQKHEDNWTVDDFINLIEKLKSELKELRKGIK